MPVLGRLERQKSVFLGSFCGKVGVLDIQLTSFVPWELAENKRIFMALNGGRNSDKRVS